MFHCSTLLALQILPKNKLNVFNNYKKNEKITNVLINEILFCTSTIMFVTKVENISNIQMEHSHLIIDLT
jgi:hypothetical protein